MMPSAVLLERLAASRFMVSRAQPSVGTGERRSRTKGAGMEFAEHRPYYPGDDVRHLDARVMARLNLPFIRQYSVDRQLPIFILLDASASMHHGEPDKFDFAKGLARTLAFVGLTSADQVQICVSGGHGIDFSSKVQGASRAQRLFDWLEPFRPSGSRPFSEAIAQVMPKVRKGSLIIMISDFLTEDLDHALRGIDAANHELLALQIASPDEIDPTSLGTGPFYLVDSETGAEIEFNLDADTIGAYRAAFAEFRDGLKQQARKRMGRHFTLSSSETYEQVFLHDFRGAGVIS